MNKRIYKKFSRRKMHRHYADLRKGAIYKVFEIARTCTMHTAKARSMVCYVYKTMRIIPTDLAFDFRTIFNRVYADIIQLNLNCTCTDDRLLELYNDDCACTDCVKLGTKTFQVDLHKDNEIIGSLLCYRITGDPEFDLCQCRINKKFTDEEMRHWVIKWNYLNAHAYVEVVPENDYLLRKPRT
jgi:hypothetical protein